MAKINPTSLYNPYDIYKSANPFGDNQKRAEHKPVSQPVSGTVQPPSQTVNPVSAVKPAFKGFTEMPTFDLNKGSEALGRGLATLAPRNDMYVPGGKCNQICIA